jgi:hypothetical protein
VNVRDRDARFADLPAQIAAVVPEGLRAEGGWTVSEWLGKSVSVIFFDFFHSQICIHIQVDLELMAIG